MPYTNHILFIYFFKKYIYVCARHIWFEAFLIYLVYMVYSISLKCPIYKWKIDNLRDFVRLQLRVSNWQLTSNISWNSLSPSHFYLHDLGYNNCSRFLHHLVWIYISSFILLFDVYVVCLLTNVEPKVTYFRIWLI